MILLSFQTQIDSEELIITDPNSNYKQLYPKNYAIDINEVSYQLWREIYDWSLDNGYKYSKDVIKVINDYDFKVNNPDKKPVTNLRYIDILIWCNARSEFFNLKPVYFFEVTKEKPLSTLNAPTKNNIYIKKDHNGFRLPTRMEWEYAARAGDGYHSTHNKGYTSNNFANYRNQDGEYHPNSGSDKIKLMSIGSFPANKFGIYDMLGNASEFIEVGYPHSDRLPTMGGSWRYGEEWVSYSRMGYRDNKYEPIFNRGFRCVTGTAIHIPSKKYMSEDINPYLVEIKTDKGYSNGFLLKTTEGTFIYSNIENFLGIKEASFKFQDEVLDLDNLFLIDNFFNTIEIAQSKSIIRFKINSDNGLEITKKKILKTPYSVYRLTSNHINEINGYVDSIEEHIINLTSDFTQGYQGSPLIDEDGNVFAIANNEQLKLGSSWILDRHLITINNTASMISPTIWKKISLKNFNSKVGNDFEKIRSSVFLITINDFDFRSLSGYKRFVSFLNTSSRSDIKRLLDNPNILDLIKKNRKKYKNEETNWLSKEYDDYIRLYEYMYR